MRRILHSFVFFVALTWAGSLLPSAALAASPQPSAPPEPSATDEQPVVDIITVDGTIDRTVRDYMLASLARSEADGHQVALQLDSPGTIGIDAPALADAFRNATVPVVVWVGPSGATVEGGAVLLAEAAGLVSIAPGAGVGKLAPRDLRDGAAPVPDEVIDAIEAWGVESGHGTGLPEIQTQMLPSQAAIDAGLARELQTDQAAPSTVLDFLQQADGNEVWTADGPVTFHSASTTDPAQGGGAVAAFKSLGPLVRVLHAVASPTAILLLLSFGLAGIAFEFTQPGFGFAGISGIVALGLGVYGMTAVPPSWYGLLLLVGGVMLLMVDVQRKRLGAMSYLGVGAYGVGAYLLYPAAAPAIAISVWLIGAMVVATVLYYFFALTVAQQAHDRVTEMQMALVGLLGEVRSDLNPVGGVVVKGTVWRARTTGDHLLAGTKVRVKGVAGVVLQVAPDDAPE